MTINFAAFSNELEKLADAGHIAELAGLGMLAAPHVYTSVTGKKPKESTTRKTELAGLGVLAAPSALKLLSKKAAAIPAAHMKMMQQHAASDAYKAKAQGGAATAPALRGQSRTFEPHELGGGGPSLELAHKSQAMAKKVAPTMPSRPVMNAARPAAQAAGGVMSRIGKVFGRG